MEDPLGTPENQALATGRTPARARPKTRTLKSLIPPHPKITDKDRMETKPNHAPKFDRVKMIIFSFVKYIASLKTKIVDSTKAYIRSAQTHS